MDAHRSRNADGRSKAASPRFVLTILFLVVTLNLFDRQLINILAQDIKVEFHLSDAKLGLLTGTAFGLFKVLFSVPVSAWADRSDRSRILAGMVALFSLFSLLCGAVSSFAGFALARMGVGLGESATVPVATAMVRDHFPNRPTSALALVMAGNPFGAFLAFLVGGLIAQHWGWRWAFVVSGPPGLVLAWLVLRTLRNSGAQEPSIGATWTRDAAGLIERPLIKPLICATASSMLIVSATNAWMPAFFIRVHALTTAEAGLYAAIAVGLGGALGALSGVFCDLIRPRVRHSESVIMVVTLLLAVPFLLAMIFTHHAAPALATFFFYNMLAYAWLAPTIRLIQDAAPRERAFAIAICSACGIFFSLGVGIPLIGWISDLLAPAYGLRALGMSLCIVVATAIGISLASHLVIWRALRTAVASTSGRF